MKYRLRTYPFKLASDLAVLAGSFLLAAFLAKKRISLSPGFFGLERREWFILILLGIIWYFSSRATHLYDDFRTNTVNAELIGLARNIGIQLMAAVSTLFLFKSLIISRFFVLIYIFFLFVLLGYSKIVARILLRRILKRGWNVRSVLVLGAGSLGQDFARAVRNYPHLGYRIGGFLDNTPPPLPDPEYLGRMPDLPRILDQGAVDEVVIALPARDSEEADEAVSICEDRGVQVRIIPDIMDYFRSRLSISLFGNIPVFSLLTNPLEEVHWHLLKRAFDILITVVLFPTVFLWLWPLIALAVKLDTRGPVFFKQERWGRKNKRILCYKFRTMYAGSPEIDENGRYQPAGRNDPRVTRVGRILRRLSLDELPQFWNVLKGEMSIVGPRPHPTPLNLESKSVVRHYMLRHAVTPGITGWAQVNGHRGESKDPLQMQRRVELDLWYIENWTFWLDLQILFFTLRQIIRGDVNAY